MIGFSKKLRKKRFNFGIVDCIEGKC